MQSPRPTKLAEVYTEKYVAFVDILGFGDLVERAADDPVRRLDIVRALETVYEIKPPTKAQTGLQAQNFSDSLILSADLTPDGLWHLLLTLDKLSWNLLSAGILARGGVARGGIHHDNRIVFGPGVNEAYRLESRIAKVPRVILGRPVIEDAVTYAQSDEIAKSYVSRLLRDDDGVWFINYLSDLAAFAHQNAPVDTLRQHNWFVAGELIRQEMQEQINDVVDQPDVYGKLAWFAKVWNRYVANEVEGREGPFSRMMLAGDYSQGRALPFRAW